MIRRAIHRLTRAAGFEVAYSSLYNREDWRLMKALELLKVDCLFDVGANLGQFAQQLIDLGYRGRIVSFEPLPDAHAKLLEASKTHVNWSVAPAMAVSNRDGESLFHETESSSASSLNMPSAQLQSAGQKFHVTKKYRVKTQRLDSYLAENRLKGERNFLKIDVQGAELMVLEGAAAALDSFIGIHIELSLSAIYEGGANALPADAILRAAGFELWDMSPLFRDSVTGRLLQYDAIYVKPAFAVQSA